ncbi:MULTISPECIES: hypothetical protein [Aquimarina]|uniref:hypothetical protein n=1 Tax=Aquimarina TaxID=290174 RepID=UPI0004B5B29A|nr:MULTISPECIES: hypothetical protein [Aquimarina]
MKNHILNLGTVLTKTQQKQISGGRPVNCYHHAICPPIDEPDSCIIYGNVCHVL